MTGPLPDLAYGHVLAAQNEISKAMSLVEECADDEDGEMYDKWMALDQASELLDEVAVWMNTNREGTQ